MTLFSPVGRESRRAYLAPLGTFMVGLVAGALATATALWIISGLAAPLPDTGTRLLVLCAVTALLLRDLGLVRFWLPENQRQVPQSVIRKPGLEAAFQFGAELGVGVRTYVSSAAPYILGIAIVLVPAGWTAAVVAACGFALGRAAMPVTRLLSQHAETWDELLARQLAWLVGCSAALAAMLATTLVLAA